MQTHKRKRLHIGTGPNLACKRRRIGAGRTGRWAASEDWVKAHQALDLIQRIIEQKDGLISQIGDLNTGSHV
jgi:hypothetical protein